MTSLANISCPAPFLNEAQYATGGGYVDGRYCAGMTDIAPNFKCCLPCPATDYIFSDTFKISYKVAEAINVFGFVCCFFLLLSWAVLPVEKTRRHYLSVCLVIGTMSLAFGFVLPLASQPDQCYDDITPNDMYSSLECAWSGAFIIAGGLAGGMWIFIRALSMHLQICWDVMPGVKFFYAAQALGWGVIAALFTTTITITGVSFRFGDACHVNSTHSMADFWGPLLGIAGASAVVQLATFGYCINVYLRNMWSDEKTETQSSSGLPSYTSSLRTRTNSARAIYRRVTKVLWLQWRGIVIVVFILVDVVFFSVVFVYLDSRETAALSDTEAVMPWVKCLITHPTETDKCNNIAQGMLLNQGTVTALLIMISLAGPQCFMLLVRWSMITGWVEWFRNKLHAKREFVSLDARRFSSDARTFELLKVNAQSPGYPDLLKTPETAVTSPSETLYNSPGSGGKSPDYFGKDIQRTYHSPSQSFSTPRAPSAMTVTRMDWDPRSTHARGGLGLHPVQDDADEDVMKHKL